MEEPVATKMYPWAYHRLYIYIYIYICIYIYIYICMYIFMTSDRPRGTLCYPPAPPWEEVSILSHPEAYIIHMHPYVFICLHHASVCTHMHPYVSIPHPSVNIQHTFSQKQSKSNRCTNPKIIIAFGNAKLLRVQPNIANRPQFCKTQFYFS